MAMTTGVGDDAGDWRWRQRWWVARGDETSMYQFGGFLDLWHPPSFLLIGFGGSIRCLFRSEESFFLQTTLRCLAERKIYRFEKDITKRGSVPETVVKKRNDYPVGPIILGFFIFVVIGSYKTLGRFLIVLFLAISHSGLLWAILTLSGVLSMSLYTYFVENADYNNPAYNTKYGMHSKGCGLENVLISWGHDNYMYLVAKGNKTTLPPAALFIIRFHSFYEIRCLQALDERERCREPQGAAYIQQI